MTSTYAQNEIATLTSIEAWCRYEARMWLNAVKERGLALRSLSPEERAAVEELDVSNGLVLREALGGKR